ncbi:MAG: hypothetical protein LQ348_007495 [Seirophora lacunosa]|nr:MAG: hypothetical protein LQ348_007495 [Seirophora lacunosa]
MSLYYEAAQFLLPAQGQSGSLKSRVFGSKAIKSAPKQIFALVAETSKWSGILSEVIDNAQLLRQERKLSPSMALLLVHDLLLSKSGIAVPASHPLRVAVVRHKARLSAELAKIRIKKLVTSNDELRSVLPSTDDSQAVSQEPAATPADGQWPHPRWVRVNTLKTTLEDQVRTSFVDFECVPSLTEVLLAQPRSKVLHLDEHIPDLIALPADTELVTTAAYRNGLIILQDKASCFPAALLEPDPEHGDYLDACAAPGNKTTHLAALLHSRCKDARKARVWACERDETRADILTKMISRAGCQDSVTVKAGQDFLLLDPEKAPWKDVGSLLLDPSCSGSGMVGRDSMLAVTFPADRDNDSIQSRSRKRKRGRQPERKPSAAVAIETAPQEEEEGQTDAATSSRQLDVRLEALSAFQLRLLVHAFRFPGASRISYSTCSIYGRENEQVVIAALQSTAAGEYGWRLLRREEQVDGLKSWPVRGDINVCSGAIGSNSAQARQVAEACIRCRAGTEHGTQGFFVAAFVRDSDANSSSSMARSHHPKEPLTAWENDEHSFRASSEEWEGLSD